ncbi:MAG: PAS domain-containing protein [Deltaproteobacteria bacterium]|nr:PAS domain-containing protein [Deltaproteobacteria bacterium]MBW2123169.1 PAS domain-containing protein [Deltaproteobacteria bacterium]
MEGKPTHEDILYASSNGVIATDAAGQIVFVNRAAEDILDLEAEEIDGAYIADVLPSTGPPVMKCLETGKPEFGRHILERRVKLVVDVTVMARDGEVRGGRFVILNGCTSSRSPHRSWDRTRG